MPLPRSGITTTSALTPLTPPTLAPPAPRGTRWPPSWPSTGKGAWKASGTILVNCRNTICNAEHRDLDHKQEEIVIRCRSVIGFCDFRHSYHFWRKWFIYVHAQSSKRNENDIRQHVLKMIRITDNIIHWELFMWQLQLVKGQNHW